MAVGKKSIMRAANAGSAEQKESEVQFMADAEETAKVPAIEETAKTAAKTTTAKKPAAKRPAATRKKTTTAKSAAKKATAVPKKTAAAKKTEPKQNYFSVKDELPVYLL